MVYVMLADGFEEIEALAVVDILRRGDVKVKTVSVYNQDKITGAHGIIVVPDIAFPELKNDAEMIVLPGGIPGTPNLQAHSALTELLCKEYAKGTYIAAICAAPMILGELNFLQGKTATCYPSFEKHLIGANCSINRVCVDGNIITSRGAGTAHDFAFTLLSLLKDKTKSDEIRGAMLYE